MVISAQSCPMSTETSPQQVDRPAPHHVIQTQQWSAPLPPPDALEHYERIAPGAAERILRMAEREQEHRIESETKTLEVAAKDAKRGQWFGAIAIYAAIVGAVITAALGFWQVAIALVGVPLLGAIQALIRRNSNE